ncbi:V-type ATP synthase subunit E [Candidatus Micrarchaeota archaeon]|nr:V-type ATP synthase subunit E [Candidatus Micrarchaeota archaeon]
MLKDIKETLLKDAKQSGEVLLKKAESELEAEFTKTKSEGERLVATAEAQAEATVENEKRERQSWAKIEAKRIVMDAKEDAVNAAFENLVDRLEDYTKTKAYSDTMKKKIAAAVSELGTKCVVHVKKGDKKKLSVSGAEMREGANILGGAIVESKNGKFKIDLSLEEMLDANRDELRKEIHARLFK